MHPCGLPECLLLQDDETGGGPFLVTPAALHAFVERIEAGYASADAELAERVSPIPGVTNDTTPAALTSAAAALEAGGQASSAAWARKRAEELRAGRAPKLVSQAFRDGWLAQLRAWRLFYEEHRSAYLFSGSAWDTAEAFRLALGEWSERAKTETGKGFSSLPGAEPEGPGFSGALLGDLLPLVAVGLGAWWLFKQRSGGGA